jgi:alpha-beta hydrolase superfamily lysophospholipase
VVVTGSALDRSHRSLNALPDAGVDSVVVPMSRRRILVGLAFLAAGFATLNVVACNHARAFLSFAPDGEKSPRPERLSLAEKLKVLVMGVSNPRPRNRKTPADLRLEFEQHRIPVGAQVRLAAWLIRSPESRTLAILFHGYSGSKDSLLDHAQAFRDLGVSTLLVDFRGSGGSSESYTTVGYVEAEDVEASYAHATRRLGWRAGDVVVFGASMGAAAVMRAQATGRIDPRALIVEVVFDRLLTTVRRRFDLMGVPSWPSAEILLFWGGRLVELDPWNHNPVDYARAIRAPTLVLHAEKDPRATLEQGRAVYEALAGPKRFVVFAGAEHESLVKAHPGRWMSEVGAFVRGAMRTAAPETARR